MNADLSPRARAIGVFVWCSFLTACIGTMVLFAFLEPDLIWHDRLTTYALGFFFLWVVAGSSAALTMYMVRTER